MSVQDNFCTCCCQNKWIEIEVLNSTCSEIGKNCTGYFIQICSTAPIELSDCSHYNPKNLDAECFKENGTDPFVLEMHFGDGSKHSFEYKNVSQKSNQFYIRIFTTKNWVSVNRPKTTICQTAKTGNNITTASFGFGPVYTLSFRITEIILTTSVSNANVLLNTNSLTSPSTQSTSLTPTLNRSSTNKNEENTTDFNNEKKVVIVVIAVVIPVICIAAIAIALLIRRKCRSKNSGSENSQEPENTGRRSLHSTGSQQENNESQRSTSTTSKQNLTDNDIPQENNELQRSNSLISEQNLIDNDTPQVKEHQNVSKYSFDDKKPPVDTQPTGPGRGTSTVTPSKIKMMGTEPTIDMTQEAKKNDKQAKILTLPENQQQSLMLKEDIFLGSERATEVDNTDNQQQRNEVS